jgi:cobalamin biosynthesis protein CbiG
MEIEMRQVDKNREGRGSEREALTITRTAENRRKPALEIWIRTGGSSEEYAVRQGVARLIEKTNLDQKAADAIRLGVATSAAEERGSDPPTMAQRPGGSS